MTKKIFSLFFTFMLVMMSKPVYSQIQPQPFTCVTQEQQDFADLWRMYIQDMHDIDLVVGYTGFPPSAQTNKEHLLGSAGNGLNQDTVIRTNQIQSTILPTNTANIPNPLNPSQNITANLSVVLTLYVIAGNGYILTPSATTLATWRATEDAIADFIRRQVSNQNSTPPLTVGQEVKKRLTAITDALIAAFQAYASNTTAVAQEKTNQAVETAAELGVYLLSIDFVG